MLFSYVATCSSSVESFFESACACLRVEARRVWTESSFATRWLMRATTRFRSSFTCCISLLLSSCTDGFSAASARAFANSVLISFTNCVDVITSSRRSLRTLPRVSTRSESTCEIVASCCLAPLSQAASATADRSAIGVIREILTGYLHGRGDPSSEWGDGKIGRSEAGGAPFKGKPDTRPKPSVSYCKTAACTHGCDPGHKSKIGDRGFLTREFVNKKPPGFTRAASHSVFKRWNDQEAQPGPLRDASALARARHSFCGTGSCLVITCVGTSIVSRLSRPKRRMSI